MKKRVGWLVLCLTLALAMSACGASGDGAKETETATDAVEETMEVADEDLDEDADLEDDAEYEESEPIVVADYDPDQYVKLGEYKGLEVDMLKSEVDEEDVEYDIEMALEEFAEEKDKEDAAESGDYVEVSYKLTVDGKELEEFAEEDRDMYLGFAELGDEVDEALIGKKTGESVEVEIPLDESYGEEFEDGDKTGVYHVTVNRVYSLVSPELTDAFVKEKFQCDTVEAYKDSIRKKLLAQTESANRSDAGMRALEQVAAASEIKGYPQDLYDSKSQNIRDTYSSFAEMFGGELEDLISEEELEEAIQEAIRDEMVVKALAKAEGITVDEKDYEDYIAPYVEEYGYEDLEEAKEDNPYEEIKGDMLQSKVCDFLLDNAKINEMDSDAYEAKYGEAEYEDEEGELIEDEDYADEEDEDFEDVDDDEVLEDDEILGDEEFDAEEEENEEKTEG